MRKVFLRIIATILILFGCMCIVTSGAAFGDIGLAIAFAGITALLSGIGLWLVPGR